MEAFPKAIFVQSANSGIVPLMIACGSNAAPEIIETLLKLDASGIGATLRIEDSHGFSAVHWACREDVFFNLVIQKLLLFDPLLAEVFETNGSQSTQGYPCLVSRRSKRDAVGGSGCQIEIFAFSPFQPRG